MIDVAAIRHFLDDRLRSVAGELDAIAERELGALPWPDDDAGARRLARELVTRLGGAGVFRHAHPIDLRACCLAREALAYHSPLADDLFAIQALGSVPIAMAGSAAQQARWLPVTTSGAAIAGFAMTEPEAGSDVASLRTTASLEGEVWVLRGHKTLISNAGLADYYTVFARTGPDPGHRGISCFVVPANTPGLVFAGPQTLSTPHPLGDLRFDDCRLPFDAIVGTPGQGFKLGMATLDALRVSVGAAACGMARRALDEALGHVTTRRQFGAPLAELQLVQQRLARSALDLDAARLLVYRAAAERDAGADAVTGASAMAKLFATEAAQRVVDDAVQLFGGRGVLETSVVDRLYRSVRPLRIYEGATDVQYVVIARALLKAWRARLAPTISD